MVALQGENRIKHLLPGAQPLDAPTKQLRGLIQANRIMAAQMQEMQGVMIQQAMATQAIMQQVGQKRQPKGTIAKILSGVGNAITPLALAGVAVLGVLGLAYKGNGQTLIQLGKDLLKCAKQRTLGAMPFCYEYGRLTLNGAKGKIATGLHYAAMSLAGIAGLNFIQGYASPKNP